MYATGWSPAVLALLSCSGSLCLGRSGRINLTQRCTPNALQGRVAAAVTLALFAPQPITQTFVAAIIAPLGYRTDLRGIPCLARSGEGAFAGPTCDALA